jgi:glyoxylase-like metal-dependent hydrolase (beta-lactamase superfamily II)
LTASTNAVEVAAGIHRIAVPTPFIVGRVNTYLFEGEPLTLLDTGPNSGTSLDELEQALRSRGFEIEDIGRVLISHQHVDHAGLAAIIKRRSGAEIVMLDRLAPALADWPAAAQRDEEVAAALMRQSGLPDDLITALAAVGRSYRAFGASVDTDRTISDGETIEIGGRRMQVMHRPGHSPSDTVLHDREGRLLVAADHLLERISSNPLISAPLPGEDSAGGRPRPLPTYLAHLRETRELEVDLVLPGHGDEFGDHRAVIDDRFAMHERRAAKLRDAISDRPKTAFELASELWGQLAVAQAYLTLSEVFGHMDLLVDQGEVIEMPPDDKGVVRFTPSGS